MDLEREYDVRGHTPGHEAHIAGWARDALAWRSGVAAQGRLEADIPYGAHPLHAYDLFLPRRDAGGAVALFIHGGYWKRLDKALFSHLAAGLNARGVPVAVMNYRLCPRVEICEIIGDARQMAAHLARRMGRPLVVIGHSAGAHLAACLVATDWKGRGMGEDILRGGVGISGIYDLRPLLATSQNDDLRMEEIDAFSASPLLWPAPAGRAFHLFVGEEESAEFIRQSQSLHAAWHGCGVAGGLDLLEGENHFTMADHLARPDSPLTRAAHELCLRA